MCTACNDAGVLSVNMAGVRLVIEIPFCGPHPPGPEQITFDMGILINIVIIGKQSINQESTCNNHVLIISELIMY